MPITANSLNPPPNRAVDLVVVTDGRGDYLTRTLSTVGLLDWPFRHRILVDDSGDREYREWLRSRFGPAFSSFWSNTEREGLAETVRTAWGLSNADFLFYLEDDFTIDEPVDIRGMIEVFDAHPKLAQLCLLRQPWNDEEKAAGGIIQCNPDDYVRLCTGGHWWVDHRRLFSLNPCLIPRWVIDMGWDTGNERGFTDRLLQDPGVSFGYWGTSDSQQVTHIGVRRSSGWKL